MQMCVEGIFHADKPDTVQAPLLAYSLRSLLGIGNQVRIGKQLKEHWYG